MVRIQQRSTGRQRRPMGMRQRRLTGRCRRRACAWQQQPHWELRRCEALGQVLCGGQLHLSPTCTKCFAVLAASISVRARGASLSCSSHTLEDVHCYKQNTHQPLKTRMLVKCTYGCWQ